MKLDWGNAFPKETKEFHNKLINILENLPEEKEDFRMKKKKYIVLVAAIVFLVGSISAYAAIKWNSRVVENFKADETMQTVLNQDKFSNQEEQSITDNNITITLKQTIQDSNFIYLLFNVTGQEDITEDNCMNLKIQFFEENANFDTEQYSSMFWGFVDQFSQTEVTHSREFEVWIQKSDDFNSKTLDIQFTGFGKSSPKAGPDIITTEGKWNFVINAESNDVVTRDINQTVTIDGCEIQVTKIVLSPLSYQLYIDAEGVKELEKADDLSLDQLDILTPLIINAIKYKDGTVITEDGNEMQAGFDDGLYYSKGRFSEVIDIDQIESILLGEKQVEVKVK
ncbi:uncharacterized protein DUF4179 [Lachnotalea glycerini]|uniref:DUF4179 domain-containing protein n=1 Tax=Lachnotalea glycerini TaxID=1763509 RepID=A0A255IJF9_9FIRM|nr:DUF4179 domain-containing protein [Lachnotalea glycerini]PXV90187.1 uncharacterized protein DUF4179 [Lachnotalea glycerini]RDY31753.1 DUF4179 domain-containing protein [Lachnotalea glycerini]